MFLAFCIRVKSVFFSTNVVFDMPLVSDCCCLGKIRKYQYMPLGNFYMKLVFTLWGFVLAIKHHSSLTAKDITCSAETFCGAVLHASRRVRV